MWLSLLLSTVVVIFVYKIMQRLVVALPLSRFSKEPTGAIRRHTANTYLYIIGMLLSQGIISPNACINRCIETLSSQEGLVFQKA